MVQKQTGSKSPDRIVTEKLLLKDGLAREAFEELTTRRGVSKEKLLSLLFAIPSASKKPLRLVDGMEDRRVRDLPARIRNWADMIERVNASPWLSPDFLPDHAASNRNPEIYPKPLNSILTPEWAEPTAKLFHSMPRTLRLYADTLQARLKFFHPAGRRRNDIGYPRKRCGLQKWLTLKLLRLVRDAAQGPRYKEVATMLSRAYEVAGKARTIGEDDLAKLETNNPWITWLLHEGSLREKTTQETAT